jgi:hypothetical protein
MALARQPVEAGRIGTVRQVRAQYLQDWLHHPDAPMTWRLDKSKSGSGALGDLGPPGRHCPVDERPRDRWRLRDLGDIREISATER